MATRQGIVGGFPNPDFVSQTGQRDAITAGGTFDETAALAAAIAEAGSAADTSAASVTGAGAASEAATASDVPGSTAAWPASQSDSASAAETTAATAQSSADQAAAGSATDSADAAFLASGSVAEAGTASDSTGATYKAKASGGRGAPWWWAQYVARHAAEREAARLKWIADHMVVGDGFAVAPAPIGSGAGFHDPDSDVAEFLAACVPFLLAA
jgi:hypothetical protein